MNAFDLFVMCALAFGLGFWLGYCAGEGERWIALPPRRDREVLRDQLSAPGIKVVKSVDERRPSQRVQSQYEK